MEQAVVTQQKKWDWREHKPNNVVVIEAGPTTGFFKAWCIYLRPIVALTDKEVDIVACYLRQRWELSKRIPDADILDYQLMSDEVRDKVIKECGISRQYLYVIMSALKKKHVFTKTGINQSLVPNITQEENGDWIFQYLLLFKEKKDANV